MIRVLSLGAGVQSSALLLMSCKGVLPKIDHAIFADTQWEPKPVYNHLAFLEVEAKCHGIPVHRVTRGDLRADAIHFRRTGGKASGDPGYKRWASMPLFVKNPDGSVGIINRQCTKEYKIEPIEKFLRQTLLGLAARQRAPLLAVEHWFGISADEQYRVRTSPDKWQVFRYPLIADITSPKSDTLYGRGYDRQDCLDWLENNGYPAPPRSACIGCPFHSDTEWTRMKVNDPESWADAVAFDLEIRSADADLQAEKMEGRLVGLPYLHRSCVPLGDVVFNERDLQAAFQFGMANECLGMCGN